jgi:hypothetical protein
MKNSLALIPAFLFLFGCPQEGIRPVRPDARPDAPPAVQLRPGAYEVVVEGIHEEACREIDAREIDGARLAMQVRFDGPKAIVDLEGLRLEGWMRNEVLRAFGEMPVAEVEEVEYDADDADEEGEDEGAPPPREDEGADARSEAPQPATHGQIELILDIEDAQHAIGALNVTYGDGCHLALDVGVRPSSGTVPVEDEKPVEPDEEPVEPDEGPCDSDEEDCG